MEKQTYEIKLDLENLLESIMFQSAWKATHSENCLFITSDNDAMMIKFIRQGFDNFTGHAGGYITATNFNPNIEHDNIRVTVTLSKAADELFTELLGNAVEQILINWTLFHFYGARDDDGEESLFHLAWRKMRAQFMVMMAKDYQSDVLATLCPHA